MSILVVCQSCKKSFKVSEKFAGKSGPCPNCKAIIQIPKAEDQVKVHAPTEFAEGGRSREGKLITKPLAHQDANFQAVPITAAIAASLMVLLVAWAGGRGHLFANPIVAAVALLLVGPPLVVAGYAFLRDDELEPYRGLPLWLRAVICAAVYAVLWGVYSYTARSMLSGELWEWAFVAPAFLAVGAVVPRLSLDIQYGDGFFHYVFYVVVTSVLGRVAGIGWPWDIGVTSMSIL